MALEFYANARFSGRRYGSYVRGKNIDLPPQAINDLLDLGRRSSLYCVLRVLNGKGVGGCF